MPAPAGKTGRRWETLTEKGTRWGKADALRPRRVTHRVKQGQPLPLSASASGPERLARGSAAARQTQRRAAERRSPPPSPAAPASPGSAGRARPPPGYLAPGSGGGGSSVPGVSPALHGPGAPARPPGSAPPWHRPSVHQRGEAPPRRGPAPSVPGRLRPLRLALRPARGRLTAVRYGARGVTESQNYRIAELELKNYKITESSNHQGRRRSLRSSSPIIHSALPR